MAILKYNDAYGYALGAGFTPEEARIMAAIAGAESNYQTNNRGDSGWSKGLWQIYTKVHSNSELGIQNSNELDDPATNARAAKIVYDEQGFRAWSTYNDGKYQKYLPSGKDYLLANANSAANNGVGAQVTDMVGQVASTTGGIFGGFVDWFKSGVLRAAFFILGAILIIFFVYKEAKNG